MDIITWVQKMEEAKKLQSKLLAENIEKLVYPTPTKLDIEMAKYEDEPKATVLGRPSEPKLQEEEY